MSGRWDSDKTFAEPADAPASHTDSQHSDGPNSKNPHGASDHTDRTKSLFLDFAGGNSLWLADGTAGSVALGTVPDIMAARALADGATNGVYGKFAMPTDAKPATAISIRIVWAPNSTDASVHSGAWSVDAKVAGAGANVTAAGTTMAFTGVAQANTANFLVVEAARQLLASTNPGDLIRLDVRRVGADAADTYVGTVNIIGAFIDYTADQ